MEIAKNSEKPEVTIGLLWHSLASSNMGVGALTVSHISILSQLFSQLQMKPNFILLGTNCRDIKYYRQESISIVSMETVTRRRLILPFSKVHKLLRQCDLVLDIGEGDSFSDIYGFKRFAKNASPKALCILYGIPFLLAPQTIGPYQNRLVRLVAKFILRKARKVYCRDSLSQNYVDALNLNNSELATDVAFALPYDKAHRVYTDGKVHVGINVSALLYNGGYSGDNMFSLRANYRSLIDKIAEHFTEKEECVVHLVPHVAFDPKSRQGIALENDSSINSLLKEIYPKVQVEEVPVSPMHSKSVISSFDFFVGSRMHACIAACSSGVPTIPIAYSRKFIGLFEDLDYPYTADCCVESEDSIFAKVVEGYQNRHELRAKLEKLDMLCKTKLEKYRSGLTEVSQLVL